MNGFSADAGASRVRTTLRGGPLDNYLVTLSPKIWERGDWSLNLADWPGHYVRDPIKPSEFCWVTSGVTAANEAEAMELLITQLAFEFEDLPMADIVDVAAREYNAYSTVQVRDTVICLVESKARERLHVLQAGFRVPGNRMPTSSRLQSG